MQITSKYHTVKIITHRSLKSAKNIKERLVRKMERMLNLTKFNKNRCVFIGRHVLLDNHIFLIPNFEKQELELKGAADTDIHLTQMAQIKRYANSHTRTVIIPANICSKFNWCPGTYLGVYQENDHYFIRQARKQDMHYRKKPPVINAEGRVHLAKFLYLSSEQKKQLDFDRRFHTDGIPVKMTLDLNEKSLITITKATEEEIRTIPRFSEALHMFGTTEDFYKMERTVITRVRNNILLPTQFIRQENIQNDDVLQTAVIGKTLYIFGHSKNCTFTGDVIDDVKNKKIVVPVCESCEPHIEKVHKRVKSAGDIQSAIESIKIEMQEHDLSTLSHR